MGVVALAVGIAFLPAPFVSFELGSDAEDKEPVAKTAVTVPEEPNWPTPAPEAGDEPLLQKALYRAQVAEVAELRKQAATAAEPFNTGVDDWWWKAAGLAFVLTLIAPPAIDLAFGRAQT